MSDLNERLDQAELIFENDSFLENKGLGNEVGYYIFDYMPEYEMQVRERIEYLKHKSQNAANGNKIMVFDLYDIMIEILKQKGYLEKCYDLEQKKGFEKVSMAVANLLQVNSTEGLIIEYIRQRITEKAVVLITGIGKCYPIIRSHTILNNLHQVIDYVPVVLFYPGKYDGQELILFGEIKDDNYYRAFKLVD